MRNPFSGLVIDHCIDGDAYTQLLKFRQAQRTASAKAGIKSNTKLHTIMEPKPQSGLKNTIFEATYDPTSADIFRAVFKKYGFTTLNCKYCGEDAILFTNSKDKYDKLIEGDVITIYDDGSYKVDYAPISDSCESLNY